jgi:hypothetical protein
LQISLRQQLIDHCDRFGGHDHRKLHNHCSPKSVSGTTHYIRDARPFFALVGSAARRPLAKGPV